jgi:hypothetical protein
MDDDTDLDLDLEPCDDSFGRSSKTKKVPVAFVNPNPRTKEEIFKKQDALLKRF